MPEISDFEGLERDSGLQAMTYDVLLSARRKHIVAVIYSSEMQLTEKGNILSAHFPALVFRNPNIEEAKVQELQVHLQTCEAR